jgi:hypothetical protein
MAHPHLRLAPDVQLMKPSEITVMVAEHVAALSAVQSIVRAIHEQNDPLGLNVIASIRVGLVREKAVFEANLAEFRANAKIHLPKFKSSNNDDDGLVRELVEAHAKLTLNGISLLLAGLNAESARN